MKIGRPNVYNRRGQTTIRFHVDKDIKKELKDYCERKGISIQSIMDKKFKEVKEEMRRDEYESN